MKKTQKPGKNKKTNAVIVILLGLLCAVSTVKSCATKRAAIQNKVDDVVYVGQGSYDPANDGKIVIVCGKLTPYAASASRLAFGRSGCP